MGAIKRQKEICKGLASIIIPIYNCRKYLEGNLDFFIKQFDERMLRLPVYTALTDAEIEFIIEKINYFCSTELKG